MSTERGWNAKSYEHISKVQRAWGIKLINSKSWAGNEIVLDAGCGPGTITADLAAKVTDGRVYAVDIDEGMTRRARKKLARLKNVKVLQANMSTVMLPDLVDVIFSNAAAHWVLDHRVLFAHFKELLREGGELLIQCGGKGNLETALAAAHDITSKANFAPFFTGWTPPWKFSTDYETASLLAELGFEDINAKLSTEVARFEAAKEFEEFLRTVVLRPYLLQLGPDHQKLFMNEFLDSYSSKQHGLTFNYVRLTVTAKK